ncbi:MAG: hypothetical protein ACT4NY_22150 [Pseudonocardiales bacterium]
MRDLEPNRVLPPALARLRDRISAEIGAADRLKEIGAEFSESTRFAEVLREVLADQDFLACEVTPRSYRHALGFDKFVLVSQQPLFQVRLHVWSPDHRYGVEHVHNHRFSFVSTVLTGELDVEIHRLDTSRRDMVRFDEFSDPGSLAWRLHEVGPVGTKLELAMTLSTGSSYYLDSDVLHRVAAAPGKLISTLFIETAATRASTTVLIPDVTVPPPKVQGRTPISTEDCRAGLERLANALG